MMFYLIKSILFNTSLSSPDQPYSKLLLKQFINRSLGFLLLILLCGACNAGDSHKSIGNSQDTTSVNKAGGPPIRDTATISQDRRDSAKIPADDPAAKGNADPSGHMTKSPKR